MESSPLRIGIIRSAVALAVAQVVGVTLAMIGDAETILAAVLATLVHVPGIVATVTLEAYGRVVIARLAYIAWLATLMGGLALWAELDGDGVFRLARNLLVPFWLFTGIAAWGMLRRGWPIVPRLTV
jgi:hypothetical protein